MRSQAQRLGWNFPYLYDETQEVARSYSAACTPDIFLFNGAMELVYRGQLDDSRPRRSDGSGNDTPVTGRDLRAALDAVIAGKRPDPATSALPSAATSSGAKTKSHHTPGAPPSASEGRQGGGSAREKRIDLAHLWSPSAAPWRPLRLSFAPFA